MCGVYPDREVWRQRERDGEMCVLMMSLGREGGDVTSPSRYVGVGRPIVLCVEV